VSADPDARDGALARFWWISVARGAVALVLGTAVILAGGRRQAIASFIGAYWLLGGLLTARLALEIRWNRGSRLGLAAGAFGVVAALLVLLRERFGGIVDPDALLALLGVSAILMGLLRVLGAFELQRRTGRRWTFGGFALGSVEIVSGLALLATDATNARARKADVDHPDGCDPGRTAYAGHPGVRQKPMGGEPVVVGPGAEGARRA
jgi:uncharacterized membrane protein HdeD (DUF308 family)